ncbi:MAG: histidine--tRNA ligase, partial [Planctomycetota bacterium]
GGNVVAFERRSQFPNVLGGKPCQGDRQDETDRQIYRFQDNGGRDVGMRFDLTVPLARFAAQHIGKLGTPFKRYHIAPVWRGENPQAGRYREFVQCDFDTIGTDSVLADIEAITVIDSLFRAIGFEEFTISINNRQILTGLLEHLDLQNQSVVVLRCLDKLAKIGREKVAAEMVREAGVDASKAEAFLGLADCVGDAETVLEKLSKMTGGNESAATGIDRLQDVYQGALASGVGEERVKIDVSIARGLDYATGMIFETTLDALPGIGSVCSGGRYDNLAGLYTKQHLPGIGASLGLDRLLAAMEQLDLLPTATKAAPVFVAFFDQNHRNDYLRMASVLRSHGIGTEVFHAPKRLGQQLKYADAHGFQVALVAGDEEWKTGKVQLKQLDQKSSFEIDYDHDSPKELIAALHATLDADDGRGS